MDAAAATVTAKAAVGGVNVPFASRPRQPGATDPWGLIVGCALGVPCAFPGPPWYLASFLAFMLVMPRICQRVWRARSIYPVAVLACVSCSCVSSLLSPDAYTIRFSAALGSSAVFALFLFGYGVTSIRSVLRGYCLSMSVISAAIIIMFVVTGQHQSGIDMFVYSSLRDWGTEYFPDWPNFLCFGIAVSCLVNLFWFRSYGFFGLNLLASILTTSRISLALIVVLAVCLLLHMRLGKNALVLLLALALPTMGIFAVGHRKGLENTDQLWQRLTKTEDRRILYSHLAQRFLERPWLGWGAVDAHVGSNNLFFGDKSFHNSYLDVLVRGGVLAFFPFLYLVYPRGALNHWREPYAWVLFFFLGSTLVQGILKHPHYVMLFSAILHGRHALLIPISYRGRGAKSGRRPPSASTAGRVSRVADPSSSPLGLNGGRKRTAASSLAPPGKKVA